MLGSKLLIATVLAAAALAAPASAAPHDNPLPQGACGTQGPVGLAYLPGVNCRVAQVDGYPRRFVVYVPRRRPPSGRAPVVLMFHGSSGTGEQFLRTSGWREQADATGLIAVFPTGVRYRVLDSGRRSTKWNAFGLDAQVGPELPPGYPSTSPWPADDVGFVDRIVGDLDARLPIDDHRVYASGFSNGAEFTARLAVERSTRLAAVAYSAGGLFSAQPSARPIPMFATLGSLDDRVLAQTGPPPLTELPRDPLGILTSPILDPFIDAHLATLGLDERPFGAIARRRSTVLRWPPQGSGAGGGVFQFGMLTGLDHHYPNGRRSAAGHDWVPRFWRFFEQHPLP
jgi:poly(3-hydroxybutyrate) depolymerase